MGDTRMQGAFTNPLMYWVGFDLDIEDQARHEPAIDFYVNTHLPEVVDSNPGFVSGHLFQRHDRTDERGGGPEYLAIYEMDGDGAARTYLDRNDGPPEGRPLYTPGPPVWQDRMTARWRMVWRRVGAGPVPAPEVIVVGTEQKATGLSYELVRSLLHPAPGSPPWLTVVEPGVLPGGEVRWRLGYRPLTV